jgi:hypothetical protein
MRKAGLLAPLIVGAMLLLGAIGHVYPSPLAQRPLMALRQGSPEFVVKVKFKCKHVDGKLVCGKTKSEPKPAPVEQPCPSGMIGKQPNCECPEGFYFAAFVGCVPVIPTAPAPSTGPKTHYCITCGGPGCLQKAPACPSGGLTTCTDVPGKTYYNCCCN